MLQYRTNAGERRKPVLGLFGELTVEQARSLAQEWLAQVCRGGDPAAYKAVARKAPTVAELCEKFMEDHSRQRNKPSTQEGYLRLSPRSSGPLEHRQSPHVRRAARQGRHGQRPHHLAAVHHPRHERTSHATGHRMVGGRAPNWRFSALWPTKWSRSAGPPSTAPYSAKPWTAWSRSSASTAPTATPAPAAGRALATAATPWACHGDPARHLGHPRRSGANAVRHGRQAA